MKELTWRILLVVILASVIIVTGVSATVSKIEINQSIDRGLAYLASRQASDGSIGPFNLGNDIAYTALAVLKMEDNATEWGLDPFDPAYNYSAQIKKGLQYIFKNVRQEGSITSDKDYSNYHTGIAIMAIVNSTHPSELIIGTANPHADGKTYRQVVQAAVDYIVDSQASNGGFAYEKGDTPDNSVSGYATLGLVYAQQPSFGINIPVSCVNKIKNWVKVIQDPISGGSNYQVGGGIGPNILKTGNLLFEMRMIGYQSDNQSAKKAIHFIEEHWNDTGTVWQTPSGWRIGSNADYQSMYTAMKGLASMNIQNLTVDGNDTDWYQEFASYIVGHQRADGSWPPAGYATSEITTSWALLTLEKSVIDPRPIGIKLTKTHDGPIGHIFGSGEIITYTISYQNLNTENVTKVVLTDSVPLPLSFYSASGGGIYDSKDRNVTWNIGTLRPNESGMVTIKVQVPFVMVDPTITNNATIKCNETGITDAHDSVEIIDLNQAWRPYNQTEYQEFKFDYNLTTKTYTRK